VEWFPVQHTSYQHFKSWWNGQYILPSDGRLWILYRYLANFHPKKQRFTQVPGNGCLVGGQFSQHFWHKNMFMVLWLDFLGWWLVNWTTMIVFTQSF
jgi:hypothetical protein